MHRTALALTALIVCLVQVASPAVAGTPVAIALSIASATGQPMAEALREAQDHVDAALKLRRQRLQDWRTAANAREASAADVAHKKSAGVSGAALQNSLKQALATDEEAARARASLLAAQGELARGGAALLKLYDALLLQRRRAFEAMPGKSAARAQAAAAYQRLSQQRDAVRLALLPALNERMAGEPRVDVDLEVRADDDVETLLEKADLAHDLEARLLRKASDVRKRMAELEEQQAVARDVGGMVGRSQLFDEEDRRMFVMRPGRESPAASERTTTESDTSDEPETSQDVDTGGASLPNDAPASESSRGTAPSPAPIVSAPNDRQLSAGAGPLPALQRIEQPVSFVQTDAAMAGQMTSSSGNIDALRALQARLKAQAAAVREKAEKLTGEAKARAQ